MIKSKLTVITFFGFMAILISCNSSRNSNEEENKSVIDSNKGHVDNNDADSKPQNQAASEVQAQVGSKAREFVKHLKSGEKLSSFFNDNWIFIYHEDNRCDGSTDGQLDNLKTAQIDSIITLQVKNDGDGWACDKKAPKIYDLSFDLKKKVADWDRFEILNYDNQQENIINVAGAGESDYLRLQYDGNNLIVKLEYRSEDPG